MENRFIDEDKLKFNLNPEETIALGLLELEIMKAKMFKSFKNHIDYEFHLDGHMPPLCVIVQDGYVRGIEIISDSFNLIKCFEKFPKLISLSLINTKIKKIRDFESLTNLKKLDLSGNGITKIEGLDQLVNLEKLNLSSNEIAEIKGLDQLVNLEKLNLENNKITKITGLKKLKKLKKLNLQFNYIEDVDTANIPNLDEIYILSCDFLYESMKENMKYDYSMDSREIDESYKEKCKKCIKKLKNLDFLLYVGYRGDRPSFERIIIEKAVRKYPESVEWLNKLCEELLKSKEFVSAKYICEQILKIDPDAANNDIIKKVMKKFRNPQIIEIVDDEEFEEF